MKIVDSQVHIWENETMNAHHRQVRTYSAEDMLAEMAGAGVDAALIHPPSSIPRTNQTAIEAAAQYWKVTEMDLPVQGVLFDRLVMQ